MLNWIVWNRTVFDMETLFTRTVFDKEIILMLNWIVWIRTDWLKWIAIILTIKLSTHSKLNCLK